MAEKLNEGGGGALLAGIIGGAAVLFAVWCLKQLGMV